MKLALLIAWTLALPGWPFRFPADHGAHPDFKTEWHYFTGNLRDPATGHEYGYELTFFRQGVLPPGEGPRSEFLQPDFKFAHFAISDLHAGQFHFWQKIARGAFNEAGFSANDANDWIGDWTLRREADDSWKLRTDRLDLTLHSLKAPVIEGENGVSPKAAGAGNASHYYSLTRLKTEGRLDGHAVVGESWFDHERSRAGLAPDQAGWDWFCFQFDGGAELMLYAMRKRDGAIDPISNGTWIDPDGRSHFIRREEFTLEPQRTWRSPHTSGVYPLAWRLRIPSHQLDVRMAERLDDQELVVPPISYWEGAIGVSGSRTGHGYMELTGYGSGKGVVRAGAAPDSNPLK